MSIPITNGNLQTTRANLNIGDYIAAQYITTAMTANGVFSNIGSVNTATTAVFSPTALNGYVYLMKIDTGLLVSLTPLYAGVNYAALNVGNLIYGQQITDPSNSVNYLVRVPRYSEYLLMAGTLGGKLDPTNIATNYNTTSSAEIIQENYNLTLGIWNWNPSPASKATNVAQGVAASTYAARLVLEYIDTGSKCTDLFH